jgi:hypothetical protein
MILSYGWSLFECQLFLHQHEVILTLLIQVGLIILSEQHLAQRTKLYSLRSELTVQYALLYLSQNICPI